MAADPRLDALRRDLRRLFAKRRPGERSRSRDARHVRRGRSAAAHLRHRQCEPRRSRAPPGGQRSRRARRSAPARRPGVRHRVDGGLRARLRRHCGRRLRRCARLRGSAARLGSTDVLRRRPRRRSGVRSILLRRLGDRTRRDARDVPGDRLRDRKRRGFRLVVHAAGPRHEPARRPAVLRALTTGELGRPRRARARLSRSRRSSRAARAVHEENETASRADDDRIRIRRRSRGCCARRAASSARRAPARSRSDLPPRRACCTAERRC